jgi:hypothetical protein
MTAVSATRFAIKGITMNRLTMWVFLLALVAFARVVVGSPDNDHRNNDHLNEKKSHKEKKQKGVPEPATILLVGAGAAAFVGVRKLLKRTPR